MILTEEEVREALDEIQKSDYGWNWVIDQKKMRVAEEALKLLLPTPVITGNWSPDRCPSCNHSLSESLGDGYYSHPTFLDRCPKCGQRLDWN